MPSLPTFGLQVPKEGCKSLQPGSRQRVGDTAVSYRRRKLLKRKVSLPRQATPEIATYSNLLPISPSTLARHFNMPNARSSMGNSKMRCFAPEWFGFTDSSVAAGQRTTYCGTACLAFPQPCALEEKRNISRCQRCLDQRSVPHAPQPPLCDVASPRTSPPAPLFSDMPTSLQPKVVA